MHDFNEFSYPEKVELIRAYLNHWGKIKQTKRSGCGINRANKLRMKAKAKAKRRRNRKRKRRC